MAMEKFDDLKMSLFEANENIDEFLKKTKRWKSMYIVLDDSFSDNLFVLLLLNKFVYVLPDNLSMQELLLERC